MALTFYKGGAGSGKTYRLLSEIIRQSLEAPEKRFYIIVPEQFTMQTQKELVRLHPRHGILNIDVLSFNRLAYRVFQEVGFKGEELLEEIGKTFLLEKIAIDERHHLDFYGTTLMRPENLSDIKAILSELMLYDVSPEELLAAAEGEQTSGPLSLKTRDISHIYREFLSRLKGKAMTMEEVPDKLCALADQSAKLRGSVMALDGFTGFTPIQLKLIRTLLTTVSELYVTVCMPEEDGLKTKDSLFSLSRETCRMLLSLAHETGTAIQPDVCIFQGEKSRLSGSAELAFLERNLFRSRRRTYGGKPEDIKMRMLLNPQKEIEEAALLISRMVREKGYRYRDFAVVSGDPETYGTAVREVFTEWNIPYFLDQKRALITNPFIEYLRAALEVCADDYSFEGMFRLLKSGMADFDPDGVNHLENYVIGTGVRGKKRWRDTFIRHYRGQDPAEVPKIEALRKEICALVDPLADVFARRGSTVLEKTTALYAFCVRSQAEEKLNRLVRTFEDEGREDLAREYAQVYPYVMGVMDRLVSLLGEEHISMKDYRSLLEAGFTEARVAIIPPGADRVMIGDVERSRISDINVLLFVGVNEGIIPKMQPDGGVFSDYDRVKLAEQKVKLKPTSREAMYTERFYLYLALTKPKEKLFLLYSAQGPDGSTRRPAYLTEVVKRLFPGLQVTLPDESRSKRLERKQTGFSLLTEGLQKIHEEAPDQAFDELFSSYLHDPGYDRQTLALLKAAGTQKPVDQIGQAAARALYGTELRNSASRLEEFCACQFRHYLDYGLKLKERTEYGFSGMDMGSVMHRSLELAARSVRTRQNTWSDLSENEDARTALASGELKSAASELGGEALYDTNRNEYQIRRMQRLLETSLWAIARQLTAGDFELKDVERDFRSTDDTETMNIPLPGGAKMTLIGRIDRLDTCEGENDETYVSIVDYKTGYKEFSLTEVYYGLQLQLVVYLNAAMEILKKAGKHPVPAGMFYYRIMDPMMKYIPGETEEELRERLLKALKGSGMVLGEREVLIRFDHSLKEAGDSSVVPAGYTQKGTLSKRSSKVLTREQFDVVQKHVSRVIREAGASILKGDADINPYTFKGHSSCEFCPYDGICGIDPVIPGYRMRELSGLDTDGVIGKMEEGTDGTAPETDSNDPGTDKEDGWRQ